ncbi:hypothetical protein FACS1894219_02250 [Clostridia bacterium]|nr:hypothetical protein FACS1894219_02250 [Clostridia bacterium]
MNNIDLLYKNPEPDIYRDDKLIENLLISEAAELFCVNKPRRDYFLKILSQPLTIMENINYRREILSDLLADENSLTKYENAFGELVALRAEKSRERVFNLKSRQGIDEWETMRHTRMTLKMGANSLLETITCIKATAGKISNTNPKSEGLCTLLERLNSICQSVQLRDIESICTTFDAISEADDFTLRMNLNETAKIISASISDISRKVKTAKSLFNIKLPRSNNIVKVADPFNTLRTDMLIHAFNEMSDLFLRVQSAIFSEFAGIPEQLQFYHAAFDYVTALNNAQYYSTFPVFTNGETAIKNMRNLTLAVKGKCDVIPNDFTSESKQSTIIRGTNNAGKTVYLRGIAVVQLFAQAGLPVIADHAELPIVNGIYSQFAAAEIDSNFAVNAAGRFEEEVRMFAEYLENIPSNSLLLLNESFQSTAYNEAAECIYPLLKVFMKRDIRFIFVTHIDKITELLSTDNTQIYVVESDHKTRRMQ